MSPEQLGEQLMAKVRAAPEQSEGWALLGDWMQERDDWRGQAISLRSADDGRAAVERGRELADEDEALSGLDEVHREAMRSLVWRGGFVLGARFEGPQGVVALEALCAHRAGALMVWASLRALGQQGVEALAASTALSRLRILDRRPDDDEPPTDGSSGELPRRVRVDRGRDPVDLERSQPAPRRTRRAPHGQPDEPHLVVLSHTSPPAVRSQQRIRVGNRNVSTPGCVAASHSAKIVALYSAVNWAQRERGSNATTRATSSEIERSTGRIVGSGDDTHRHRP